MFEGTPNRSAEKDLLLTPEAFEIRVHRFVKDPVGILRELRQEFITAADTYEDFDVIGETMIILDEFAEFMYEHQLDVAYQPLKDYIEFAQYTSQGDTGLFTLLRSAGYEKEEIRQWLLVGEKVMPEEDRFITRQSIAILERVYGND